MTTELCPVRLGDAPLLFAWRNDVGTRANSFNPEPVGLSEHLHWLYERLQLPGYRGYILEDGGVPVAVVWYTRAKGCWEVSVTVAPGQRGRGYGTAILRLADAELGYPAERRRALVFADNAASLVAFQNAGYEQVGRMCVVLERR